MANRCGRIVSDLGTINSVGSTGGGAVYEYNAAALTARYVRVSMTCTGGTAMAAASIVGKRRTITD